MGERGVERGGRGEWRGEWGGERGVERVVGSFAALFDDRRDTYSRGCDREITVKTTKTIAVKVMKKRK